ncbi:hypothetical protein HAX54_033131, partial [Datura stramonium]|nr:hypothetical protein [Datura stramonium]
LKDLHSQPHHCSGQQLECRTTLQPSFPAAHFTVEEGEFEHPQATWRRAFKIQVLPIES